jgi:hypothetical protein
MVDSTSVSKIIIETFGWLCEQPFDATYTVLDQTRGGSNLVNILVDFANQVTRVKVSLSGFGQEFNVSVASIESPPLNPWSCMLTLDDWAAFERVALESTVSVYTPTHLLSLCRSASDLCRRYPDLFLPGSFARIQAKEFAIIDAKKRSSNTDSNGSSHG